MSAPKVCNMLFGHCKHGHPRTEETTFKRKVTIRHKSTGWERTHIVRECRVCHAMRENRAPSWSRFQSKSKWSELRRNAAARTLEETS